MTQDQSGDPAAFLRQLYDLFGRVVLLQIPRGTKRPILPGWQKLTFEQTREEVYQRELEKAVRRGGNIGVLLGPASAGLLAIDIDRDDLVVELLKLNPELEQTTRTRGARGNQFFLRPIPGTSYPNGRACYALKTDNGKKYGEWRCGGAGLGAQSVVFGAHPSGATYEIIVAQSPVTIDFESLKWLFPWESPEPQEKGDASSTATSTGTSAKPKKTTTGGQAGNIYADLFRVLGNPFLPTQRGYLINEPFFARLWGTKRLAFYDRAAEDFYLYADCSGLYTRLRAEEVMGLIRDDLFDEAFSRGYPDIGFKVNVTLLKNILNLIKTDAVVCKPDFFAPDPLSLPVIHTANGMACIDDQGEIQLRPFDPSYRSRNQIPIKYDPGAQCIHFKERLLEQVLYPDDIDVLQRYCGLILLKGNRAQKYLMMLGQGGTGKGTIVRLITLVIGRRNVVQLRVGKLNERFETVRCVGKLLLNVVEATADYLNQEGAEVMKALVGHDPMEGEKKNIQEPVSFEGTFPIIVTSNEKLNVRLAGDEAAQSRRVLIIEFPNRRPSDAEIIDHFEQLLFDHESEGIFAWMIEGARKHWLELSQGKGFAVSDPQKRRVEDLINRSKSVETFVLTELNSTPVGDVTTGELYDAYCTSCMAKEWTPFREQKFEEVSRHLILRHFDICKRHDIQRIDASGKTRSRRGYSGIEII